MTEASSPELVADGDGQLIRRVRQALNSMNQRCALMVISQPSIDASEE